MQKSVFFSVFFCFFFFTAWTQEHATRTMKKEMKAYNRKIQNGDKVKMGQSEFKKAPKKPFLQRLGIVKVNALIPNFFDATNRQDKKTSRRMKKNYRTAKKRMKKNFSLQDSFIKKEDYFLVSEV